jgi:hypothetical protein
MSNDETEGSGKVALADAIAGLRSQIREAVARAADVSDEEKFRIKEVELELTVVAEGTVKAGGEVGWWIFKAGADVSAKEGHTHKVKLKLEIGGGKTLVGSSIKTN